MFSPGDRIILTGKSGEYTNDLTWIKPGSKGTIVYVCKDYCSIKFDGEQFRFLANNEDIALEDKIESNEPIIILLVLCAIVLFVWFSLAYQNAKQNSPQKVYKNEYKKKTLLD